MVRLPDMGCNPTGSQHAYMLRAIPKRHQITSSWFGANAATAQALTVIRRILQHCNCGGLTVTTPENRADCRWGCR